jgi:hypothetical protein
MAKYDLGTIAEIAGEYIHATAYRARISNVETDEASAFLARVANSVIALTTEIDPEDWEWEYPDRIAEIADNAPSVYTWTVWQEFIGLSAWQFDPADEYGDDIEPATATMEDRARVRLFMIARAVAASIATDIAATISDDDE